MGRDLTELMRRLLSSKTSSFTRTNMELLEEVAETSLQDWFTYDRIISKRDLENRCSSKSGFIVSKLI